MKPSIEQVFAHRIPTLNREKKKKKKSLEKNSFLSWCLCRLLLCFFVFLFSYTIKWHSNNFLAYVGLFSFAIPQTAMYLFDVPCISSSFYVAHIFFTYMWRNWKAINKDVVRFVYCCCFVFGDWAALFQSRFHDIGRKLVDAA